MAADETLQFSAARAGGHKGNSTMPVFIQARNMYTAKEKNIDPIVLQFYTERYLMAVVKMVL